MNNAYVETVNDSLESSASSQGDSAANAFSEARLNRQNSRDEALELLDGVLEDVEADSEAKQAAVEEASALAQKVIEVASAGIVTPLRVMVIQPVSLASTFIEVPSCTLPVPVSRVSFAVHPPPLLSAHKLL